jgi:DNA-binding response OmpR family regulator
MEVEETNDLNGKRIVVVEDDFLLATDICRELRELGATVLGPAPTPFYATQLIGRRKVDAAVLDVRLHGTNVFSVADLLRDKGVPILFATAYDRAVIPARFQEARLLKKPLDRKNLLSEIIAMIKHPTTRSTSFSPPSITSPQRKPPAQIFASALARSLLRTN